MDRHVATATQYRNLERQLAGLRLAMDRVALGKDATALADALVGIKALRSQLDIVEKLLVRLDAERASF